MIERKVIYCDDVGYRLLKLCFEMVEKSFFLTLGQPRKNYTVLRIEVVSYE